MASSAVLAAIAALLAMLAGLLQLLHLWFLPEQRKSMLVRAERFAAALVRYPSDDFAQIPLRALAKACDAILGEGPWSVQALWRVGALSILLLVGGLGTAGWFVGQPMGFESSPWETFQHQVDAVPYFWRDVGWNVKDDICTDEPAQCDAIHQYQEALEPYRWLRPYAEIVGGGFWKWAFTAVLALAIAAVTAVMNAITFSSTRSMVQAVLGTKNAILRNSVWFLNLFLAVAMSSVTIVLVLVLANPAAWLLVGLGIYLSSVSLILAFGLLAVTTLAAWALSGVWIKVVALTGVAPALALSLAAPVGSLFPAFGKACATGLSAVLRRAAKHDDGLFAFLAAIALSVAGLLGGLAALLPG